MRENIKSSVIVIGITALITTLIATVWIDKCLELPVLEWQPMSIETEALPPKAEVITEVKTEVIHDSKPYYNNEILVIENHLLDKYADVPLADELKEYVIQMCEITGVPTELGFAMLMSESNGKWIEGDWDEDMQKYRSIGFFQIRDVNHARLMKEYGIDATTRKGNIEAGITMMAELMRKYPDDLVMQITSYKAGEYKAKEICANGYVIESASQVIEMAEAYGYER